MNQLTEARQILHVSTATKQKILFVSSKKVVLETTTLRKYCNESVQMLLTPDLSPSVTRELWKPFVEDVDTQSYSYYLPASSFVSSSLLASPQDLDRWFLELHPSNYNSDGDGSWTGASYRGEQLLRKTAWCTLQDECSCEYGEYYFWIFIMTLLLLSFRIISLI